MFLRLADGYALCTAYGIFGCIAVFVAFKIFIQQYLVYIIRDFTRANTVILIVGANCRTDIAQHYSKDKQYTYCSFFYFHSRSTSSSWYSHKHLNRSRLCFIFQNFVFAFIDSSVKQLLKHTVLFQADFRR